MSMFKFGNTAASADADDSNGAPAAGGFKFGGNNSSSLLSGGGFGARFGSGAASATNDRDASASAEDASSNQPAPSFLTKSGSSGSALSKGFAAGKPSFGGGFSGFGGATAKPASGGNSLFSKSASSSEPEAECAPTALGPTFRPGAASGVAANPYASAGTVAVQLSDDRSSAAASAKAAAKAAVAVKPVPVKPVAAIAVNPLAATVNAAATAPKPTAAAVPARPAAPLSLTSAPGPTKPAAAPVDAVKPVGTGVTAVGKPAAPAGAGVMTKMGNAVQKLAVGLTARPSSAVNAARVGAVGKPQVGAIAAPRPAVITTAPSASNAGQGQVIQRAAAPAQRIVAAFEAGKPPTSSLMMPPPPKPSAAALTATAPVPAAVEVQLNNQNSFRPLGRRNDGPGQAGGSGPSFFGGQAAGSAAEAYVGGSAGSALMLPAAASSTGYERGEGDEDRYQMDGEFYAGQMQADEEAGEETEAASRDEVAAAAAAGDDAAAVAVFQGGAPAPLGDKPAQVAAVHSRFHDRMDRTGVMHKTTAQHTHQVQAMNRRDPALEAQIARKSGAMLLAVTGATERASDAMMEMLAAMELEEEQNTKVWRYLQRRSNSVWDTLAAA